MAMGLLLTAPGIPMLFMGQEFLEDELWSDDPRRAELMIWWDGLDGADRHMAYFHQFTRELIWLRRQHPALRDEPIIVYRAMPELSSRTARRCRACRTRLEAPCRRTPSSCSPVTTASE
jgi:hypothetical protein